MFEPQKLPDPRDPTLVSEQNVFALSPVPAGLITKARLHLQAQEKGRNPWLQTTATGLVYVHGLLTIIQGDYQGQSVQQIIALSLTTSQQQPTAEQRVSMEMWTIVGQYFIQHLLESAQCHDLLRRYQRFIANQGDFDYQDLNGLVCIIELGQGYYAPFQDDQQPQLKHILKPNDPHYYQVMNQHTDSYQHDSSSLPQPHFSSSQWSFIQ